MIDPSCQKPAFDPKKWKLVESLSKTPSIWSKTQAFDWIEDRLMECGLKVAWSTLSKAANKSSIISKYTNVK